jgi:Spy/CpxP family protein refolding chaperone
MAQSGSPYAMTDRLKALAVLVAIFLVGCALGATGSYYWMLRAGNAAQMVQPQLQQSQTPLQQPQTQMMRDPGQRRIVEFLQLTPEQESRFREIMEDSRKQLDVIRSEEMPKIQAAQAEMNRQISELLTEEQRKKYSDFTNYSRQDRRGGRRNSNGSADPPAPSFPTPSHQ